MFNVNTSLIRFWEKEFSAIKPKKNKKGNRLFTVKDITTIDRIYELVKEEGHTLDGARKALREQKTYNSTDPVDVNLVYDDTPSTKNHQDVIDRLEVLKRQLISMKS